jgi:uncharacterized protein (DUF1330 family)
MTQVAIKDFLNPPTETSASTRTIGEKVRNFIEEHWDSSDKIVVEFEPDLKATISFMDEAFAKLLDTHTPEEFLNKVSFKDLSEYNQSLVLKVLRNRMAHARFKAN